MHGFHTNILPQLAPQLAPQLTDGLATGAVLTCDRGDDLVVSCGAVVVRVGVVVS